MVVNLDAHPMSDDSMDPVSFKLIPEETYDSDVKDNRRNQLWRDVSKDLLTG